MNVARAQAMLDDMIEGERAANDNCALQSIARRAGVGFWTLHNIKRGRPKAIKDTILDRLQLAYLDFCQRQLARWEHQLTIAEATSDDNFDDLRRAFADASARLANARRTVAGDRDGGLRGRRSDRPDFLTGADRSASSRANSSQRRR